MTPQGCGRCLDHLISFWYGRSEPKTLFHRYINVYIISRTYVCSVSTRGKKSHFWSGSSARMNAAAFPLNYFVKNLGKYSASFTHWFNDTINLIFIILFLSSIFSILFLFFNWLISWITRYTYSIDSWILFCCRIHIYGLVWLHIFHHIEISPCDIPGYAKYCENSLNTPMIVSIIVTGINMIIYANYLKDIYLPLEKDQPM